MIREGLSNPRVLSDGICGIVALLICQSIYWMPTDYTACVTVPCRYASPMAVLTLERVLLAFDHIPLLDDVVLQVEPGERLALVGRTGGGPTGIMPAARRFGTAASLLCCGVRFSRTGCPHRGTACPVTVRCLGAL